MTTSLRSPLSVFACVAALCACTEAKPVSPSDLGGDAAHADAAALDAALGDGATADLTAVDGGQTDAARGDGGGSCAIDSECASGVEWCVDGACVPCDNGGLLCDIFCAFGWTTYERNGCQPCECAPVNQCESDGDCHAGDKCAAGAFCWCSGANASCCQGNVCVPAPCGEAPPPVGCIVRGCPAGETCNTTRGCASSGCGCETTTGNWSCTPDCGGGICEAPTP